MIFDSLGRIEKSLGERPNSPRVIGIAAPYVLLTPTKLEMKQVVASEA
jgi:hypothetical protein